MLIHGLQGFHRSRLFVPANPVARPDRHLLDERYVLFRRLTG